MKVILDTNVFISGLFFSGPPYKILEAWRDGIIELVASPEILEEYYRVGEILAQDHPGIDLSSWFEYAIQRVVIFSTNPFIEPICDDPDDDKFLTCALASECKIIVSGDKHLLRVSGFESIEIVRPREFLEKYLT
ncbi:MAG: putative toxin-antitoxin system toxin component, PIN family [Anaerolineales bacterium]